MEIRYAAHPKDVKSYDTHQLRAEFHGGNVMKSGEVNLIYTHYDRFIFGGISPVWEPLELPNYDALKADYFLERRELGIINIGWKGSVIVDEEEFELGTLDVLYVGKGKKELLFKSVDPHQPAKFYINSSPAHQSFPTVKATREEANIVNLGTQVAANKRTIYQYIHEDGIQSCQLVMGYTELKAGNVWNTFPPHTHDRRMEVYFYFDLPQDQIVMHFMGQPQESRHLAVKNEEAVISPPWSIHAGAGTSNYKFIWGMAGENKAFSDMDSIPLKDVL